MTACRPKGIKTITFYYFIDFVLVLFPDGQKHARVATIVVELLMFLVSLSLSLSSPHRRLVEPHQRPRHHHHRRSRPCRGPPSPGHVCRVRPPNPRLAVVGAAAIITAQSAAE